MPAPGGPKSTPYWSKIEAKSLPGPVHMLISTPFWSKIEAKSLPGAVQMASKAVFNTAAISMLISYNFLRIVDTPGGTLLVHLGVHLGPFAAFG